MLKDGDLKLILRFNGCVVQIDIFLEDFWHGRFLKNSLPRTLRLTCPAVNALIGMNIELVGELVLVFTDVFVNAIDRTYANASGVEAIAAKAGYCPRHNNVA